MSVPEELDAGNSVEDVVGLDASNQILTDAINEVKNGACSEKSITIDGETFTGLTGICVTKYADRQAREIEFKITSEGDLIHIGVDAHFPDGKTTKILIRTKCADEECNLEEASSPLGDILFQKFQLLPVGNIVVQAEGGAEGIITIRAIEGTGQLQIIYGEEVIGVIDAPTAVEQDQSIENIGYVNPETLGVSLEKAIRDTRYAIEENVDDLTAKSNKQVGCEGGGANGIDTPIKDPVAFLTILLFFLYRHVKGKVAAIPSGIADGTRRVAEKFLK